MPNGFVNPNILVYAADESTPVSGKTKIAREILLLPDIHVSVQVLNEFIAASRHPAKRNLPREREKRWLTGWLLRPVASLSRQTFLSALSLHIRYQIAHWDSLILASALETGCDTIYSEDLNHGQSYEGLRVVNPFL